MSSDKEPDQQNLTDEIEKILKSYQNSFESETNDDNAVKRSLESFRETYKNNLQKAQK